MAPEIKFFLDARDPIVVARRDALVRRSPDLLQALELRRDANETLFLARQLEAVERQVLRAQHEVTKFRDLLPVDMSYPEGAETVKLRIRRSAGEARWGAAKASDIPNVEATMNEEDSPLKEFYTSFHYSLSDLRAAAYANVPLSTELAMVAMETMEEHLNSAALLGEASVGIPGFFTNDTIASGAVANGAWSNPATTGEEMYDDLSELVQACHAQTGYRIRPNRIALPPVKLEAIRHKVYKPEADTKTVLKVFIENHPGIALDWAPELEAGNGVDASNDVMVAYNNEVNRVKVAMPIAPRALPPQQDGLLWKVIFEGKTGGTLLMEPLSALKRTGI